MPLTTTIQTLCDLIWELDPICPYPLMQYFIPRRKTTSQNSASGKYLVIYVKEYELSDHNGGVLE